MSRNKRVGRRLELKGALLALVVMASAAEAHAHFLFIRIGTQAEGGRWAEVFFSEQAEAGDPKFIAKVAQTRLWVQTKPGEFRELAVHQAPDRLRAAMPADRSLVVVGECQYGVIARPKQTPFLLRYYPKAVTGMANELNRMTPRPQTPFEIRATFEIDGRRTDGAGSRGIIRLAVLRDGRPVPGAVFTAIDSSLTEQTIKAGPDGSATWTLPEPGHYCLYTRKTIKQPGNLDGKTYDEIREFATLAFRWPVEDAHQADSEAVALFKDAIAHRAAWRDFPGFSAQIEGWLDGRAFSGKVTVQAEGSVQIQVDDPAAKPWLQDQLDSMVLHRQPPSADAADTHTPQFRFVDEPDGHPLGKLIAVHGDLMGSSYRVKDHQIFVVNRRMSKRNMTITVLENQTNREGHYLPHDYVVQYWDAATGKLQSAETIQDRWQRVGSWDLPAQHTVTTASDSGLSIRAVRFSNLKLLGR